MSHQPPTACRAPEALMGALIRGCQRGGKKEAKKSMKMENKGGGLPFLFMGILCFRTVFTSKVIPGFRVGGEEPTGQNG